MWGYGASYGGSGGRNNESCSENGYFSNTESQIGSNIVPQYYSQGIFSIIGGSGGGSQGSTGSRGGGYISFISNAISLVNSRLYADGEQTVVSGGGAGSGGSIVFSAATCNVNSSILSVVGGNTVYINAGGGGGGRISLLVVRFICLYFEICR